MHKLLIANRGEIACRILRSARALGLATVAVHSEVDQAALHVVSADQAVALRGNTARESYLDVEQLLAAARASGADALHPGYGFLAENADFARAVQAAGLTWVGPAPETIDAMGDKVRSRAIARAAGVPLLPGSERLMPDALEGLEALAETVGYPLLVKASGGGGGIGMQRVDGPESLRKTVTGTQALAQRAFGDAGVFLERYVARARHIEIQVLGFGDGRAIHLFERECSIQRRFQKIVEESPSTALTPGLRQRMADAAVALARAQRYAGVGTVEFVFDDERGEFHFLEMNTRIQVEHPVTELLTGLDLVALQLRLAAGEAIALTQADVQARGHAIEVRLCAENPAKNYLPATGCLERLDFPPASAGLRVDTGVRSGDRISHFYDPMIAKLIVHGEDRPQAIARMAQALEGTVVQGPASNLALLRQVLLHPAFVAGRTHTSFLAEHRGALLDGA